MHVLILVLALFFTGCAKPAPPPVKVVQEEEVTWVVEKIMAKWKHRRGQRLRLEHAYVYFGDTIKGLRLEISSQEILEVPEARNLLVDFVEELLRDINTDPLITSQLALGTLTPDDLSIVMNFESFFGRYVDPFYVGNIKLKRGIAYYYAFELKYEGWYAWKSRVEPYDKTREISILERAAEKEAVQQINVDHPFSTDTLIREGIIAPVNQDDFSDPSPLRKF
ncbi:MAG: hypothetical protein H0U49_07380 [Parachlamydiaceae bacterium]|nr:hypothetical protein [Parachlamydiaceae bacterium]